MDMVPILIANPKPFRIIVRDEDDVWEPTLENINRSSYDYVKLHRASAFFDADLKCNFPICVAFDGSFVLPACSDYRSVEESLDEFNRVFASILVGGVYITSVQPSDLSEGKMSTYGYYRHTRTLGGNGNLYKALGNRDAGADDNIKLLAPLLIVAKKIELAYQAGAETFKNIDNLSPSLFITAFTYFIDMQTREALTNAWICIEQVLEYLWRETVLTEVKAINIEGRGKFMGSQRWSAAHKIEMFFQLGIVDKDTYTKLSNARNARNKFAHSGKAPKYDSAKNALTALIELINAASKHKCFLFKCDNLSQYLIKPKGKHQTGQGIGKVEDFDWSKVSHWKPLLPIPGETGWEGDFETFSDITLQSVSESN